VVLRMRMRCAGARMIGMMHGTAKCRQSQR